MIDKSENRCHNNGYRPRVQAMMPRYTLEGANISCLDQSKQACVLDIGYSMLQNTTKNKTSMYASRTQQLTRNKAFLRRQNVQSQQQQKYQYRYVSNHSI